MTSDPGPSERADTIAAIASAPGHASAAVIRISGPATTEALAALGVSDADRAQTHAPGSAARVSLRLARAASSNQSIPQELPVPAMLIRWFAPRSYTGEDAAELVIPGHPALAERLLSALCDPRAARARPATAGEFTARAFLNGRLTLDQAEGVAATIAAQTQAELTAAHRLLSGHLGDRVRAWADELTTLLALVEAGIDFTDQEDVIAIAPVELASRLSAVRAAVGTDAGDAHASVHTGDVRVVLGGRPNAGKSALFNALLGRRRVLVSERAGATRDAIVEPLELASPGYALRVQLVDLPGVFDRLGDGSELSEPDRAAIDQARAELQDADVVVHCDPAGVFDPVGTLGPSAAVIHVRTMADRPHAAGRTGPESIAVSVLDGRGLDDLRDAIRLAAAHARGIDAQVPRRHADALQDALRWLDSARDLAASGSDEMIAEALRAVLDELGRLVGRVHADDVIGRVFATFCVGK